MPTAPSTNDFLSQLEPIRHALFAYARRASSRPEEAPDLVQQATLIGWREFSRFSPGSNFKAWMFRILVNTIYTDNKRARRDPACNASDVDPKDLTIDLTASIEQEEAWQTLLGSKDRLSELLDQRLADALETIIERMVEAHQVDALD